MKKNVIRAFTIFGLILSQISCETFDLDNGLNDPNAQSPEKSNPTYLLTSVQKNFAEFHYELHDDTKGIVRMTNMFGDYGSTASPDEVQTQWSTAYADILSDIKSIETIAKNSDIPHHLGIAKILKAYTMVDLVDFFGDVPYSEALLLDSNLNPKADSGESIYDAMLLELDNAISLLNSNSNATYVDMYYSSKANWIKLANTLKLKMYNNLRLTRDVSTQVNALIAGGNLFSSNADDFNFKYSKTTSPQDFRHPDFSKNYFAARDGYLSNSYMLLLTKDKTANLGTDPRLRSYFYRQRTQAPTGTDLPCAGNGSIPLCYIGGGYWGRDHADNTGLPNDNVRRTIVGLYPFGGKFDNGNNNSDVTNHVDKGAEGEGILNILDYSFVQFMLAELALNETGVNGNPLTYLNNAVTANIAKVRGFRKDKQLSNASTDANVAAYLAEIGTDYAALGDNTQRMNYIAKEFYIALWGNGFECYNLLRRTGMILPNPANIGMQAPVTGSAAGNFVRSFPYPKNAINNNSNLSQHLVTKQVFWDNNAAGFVK